MTTKLNKRKSYSPAFKAKVALEAAKGKLTINQIAQEFKLHPNQVSKWKKKFLESLPAIFEHPNNVPTAGADEELINQLYQEIGKLKVELDWLKKKSELFS
jgi:transposase